MIRMDDMKELTKLEELVMIAVWRLNKDAYGLMIKKKVKEISGKEYLYNTLYTTFDQLTRKGYLSKHFGEAEAVRGGKRKVYFRITKSGLNSLENAYSRNVKVWEGISKELLQKEYTS